MEHQLKRIQDKLQHLLKQYQLLHKEKEKVLIENTILKENLKRANIQKDVLEQRVAALKLADGNISENEKKELEKRMNGYLREIDRCIAMLEE
ncbi:MAG: hypothetical protein ACKVOW_05225 [Chitinophagaceae bacterium]